MYLRDAGETEVGGFGIAAADDLLYVEEFQTVRQTCGVASVAFEDQAVADYFDRQVDAGRSLSQAARIWLHTHPGSCPQPSATDQETFARVFGRADWSVMFILAQSGATYCRLEFHVGPGGGLLLPVEVDYHRPFPAADHNAWRAEYLANIHVEPWPNLPAAASHGEPCLPEMGRPADAPDWLECYDDRFPGDFDGQLSRHFPRKLEEPKDDHHITT